MKKINKIILIIASFIIVFTIIGWTFAYLRWQTSNEQKTEITFIAESGFSCSADGGGNITSENVRLVPTEINDKLVVILKILLLMKIELNY